MRVLLRHVLSLSLLAAVAVLGAAPELATPLQAQSPQLRGFNAQRYLVLQAGEWYLDVDAFVGAARVELPLDQGERWLLVPSVTYAHYTLQSPIPRLDLFAPEALVHLQLGHGRVRPYIGGGAGLILINMFHTFDPVLSLGAGVRADLTSSLSARLELDTHAFGQFKAGSIGWSMGLARRF